MKKIYILRHAKAVKDVKIQDFQRKLTSKGKQDLKRLFDKLQGYVLDFDLILSSPSERTAKTAKKVGKFYNFTQIEFKDELYLASLDSLYGILKGIDSKYNGVLLVGHNPGLLELGEFLSSLCLASFPTSSMLCLEFDIDDFKELRPHSGKLVFFEHVRKLRQKT